MNRRDFVAATAFLPLAARSGVLAETSRDSVDAGRASPAHASTNTPLLDRYHLTRERVLRGDGPAYTPEFLMQDLRGEPGRRFTNFSGDTSGRWIGALASSSSSFGDSFPVLDEFVKQAIATQHGEGYFGKSFNADHPNDDDLALLWGNGRLLVGLMEYHRLKPDAAVLASARKLGDFLVRLGPAFNSEQMANEFGAGHFATSYICWTQQTEGLAALFAATNDARYRDLCADISARTVRRPGDHVHGYLCSVRGTLALYQATKDQALLDRAAASWKEVNESGDILITGGVPEAWSPKKLRTEGCAECDWLRLSLGLYRATGDSQYLEAAEKMIFNEFAMNQFASGDYGHAVLDSNGALGQPMVRAWWCCTLHGLRAFPDVHDAVFREAEGKIFYELPLDARMKSSNAAIEARSSLAANGKVTLAVQSASSGSSLTVRKPSWATSVAVSQNGRRLAATEAAKIQAGDRIEIRYGMKLRAESADRMQTLPDRKALFYGPWLLGASSMSQPRYFNELQLENVLIEPGHLSENAKASSAFSVPIAAAEFEYVPAEFPEQKMHVQLQPVAEQTGYEPARWVTAFRVEDKS